MARVGSAVTPLAVLSAAVAICAAWASIADAETYHVSAAKGDDAFSGRTADQAFRSFAKAMSILRPGDRLMIEAGDYQEPLKIDVSGAPGTPIEIDGASGPRPKLRAPEDAVVVDADYVTITHLDAVGVAGSGILIQPSRHHILIEDNVVHDSGTAGIAAIQTDYLSILHNVVYGNSKTSPWQGSGIGIYQAANFDDAPGFHNIIAGNISHDNFNLTPDPKLPAAQSGHTTDGNGIIIDDFRHTQVWRGKTTPAYRSNTLLENNVTYRNGGRGINIFFSDRVTIRNNTSVANLLDTKLLGASFGELQLTNAKNIKIFNNLWVPSKDQYFGLVAVDANSVSADHNETVGPHDKLLVRTTDMKWGANNYLGVRPGFENAGDTGKDCDFHLTGTSDALQRGDGATGSKSDLDGHRRPDGRPIDLGAYQYTSQ